MPAYSLDGVFITAGGRLITGFGESDAMAYKFSQDDWEPVNCCDGAVVNNRIHSRRGEITLTLRYDSPANRILSTIADTALYFSFNAVFPNGRVVESGETLVMKRPEPTFGAKTSDEVWVLSCNILEVVYEQGV